MYSVEEICSNHTETVLQLHEATSSTSLLHMIGRYIRENLLVFQYIYYFIAVLITFCRPFIANKDVLYTKRREATPGGRCHHHSSSRYVAGCQTLSPASTVNLWATALQFNYWEYAKANSTWPSLPGSAVLVANKCLKT